MINIFLACILFADDMALMAPSRDSMQQLINICAEYCLENCLKFNVKKTKIMVFGKYSNNLDSLSRIELLHGHGVPIEFVTSCKYLGFYIRSGTHFKFSVHEDLCSFFGSANSILNFVSKPREQVQLQLLYSNCVPRLTYGSEVKDITASEKQKLNVAINRVLRFIYNFTKHID